MSGIPTVFPYLSSLPDMIDIAYVIATVETRVLQENSFFTFNLLLSSLAGKRTCISLSKYILLSSLAVLCRA